MAGAILAARIARIPVILDGYVVTAAAAVLEVLQPGALDHCLAGHCSAEPAHRRLWRSSTRRRSSISACALARDRVRCWLTPQ